MWEIKSPVQKGTENKGAMGNIMTEKERERKVSTKKMQ